MAGELPNQSENSKDIDDLITDAMENAVIGAVIKEAEASPPAQPTRRSTSSKRGLRYELLGDAFGPHRTQFLGRDRHNPDGQ